VPDKQFKKQKMIDCDPRRDTRFRKPLLKPRGKKQKNLAGIAARLLGLELYPAKPPDF
jgi:hypothetical protein